MTALSSSAATMLDRIRRARLDQHRLPADSGDIDLDSAYRIQAELGEGRSWKGYKLVAFDGNAGTPLYGRLYADMLREATVELSTFLWPRLGVRLALVTAGELAPNCTPGQCHLAIGGIFLALEVTDSVWADGERTLAGEVADNASAGAFVLGEHPLQAPLHGSALLTLDGTSLASYGLERFGDVASRLGWLAARTGGLSGGTLVLLGPTVPEDPIGARPGLLELSGPGGSGPVVELGA